jgi:hypothetical protein
MSGTQLATLATIGWAILTVGLLVIGTSSVGIGWTILPSLVRGAHDWAAEHVASRASTSPAPWAGFAPSPASTTKRTADARTASGDDDDLDLDPAALVEIEDLGTRSI